MLTFQHPVLVRKNACEEAIRHNGLAFLGQDVLVILQGHNELALTANKAHCLGHTNALHAYILLIIAEKLFSEENIDKFVVKITVKKVVENLIVAAKLVVVASEK